MNARKTRSRLWHGSFFAVSLLYLDLVPFDARSSKFHSNSIWTALLTPCRCSPCFPVLQLLNSYVDELQRRGKVTSATVKFWVIEDGRLTQTTAELPTCGSLGPLFYAFSLISADELQSGAGSSISSAFSPETDLLSDCGSRCRRLQHYTSRCTPGVQSSDKACISLFDALTAGQDSTDFLEWLSYTVKEALRATEQHESMKRVIRELRASLEDKFGLAAIQVPASHYLC